MGLFKNYSRISSATVPLNSHSGIDLYFLNLLEEGISYSCSLTFEYFNKIKLWKKPRVESKVPKMT